MPRCKTRSSNNDWRNAFSALKAAAVWYCGGFFVFGAALARRGLVSIRSRVRHHLSISLRQQPQRWGRDIHFILTRTSTSISHARVAIRLALAFGVVCLVMSLSAAVGIWRLAGLQDIADDLGGASSERALLACELHAIVVLSSARAETLLEIDNPAYAARIDADRRTTSPRSSEVRKRLDELAADAESQALFDAIDKAGNGFRTVRDDLVKRRKAGEALPPDAIANQLRPAADAYAVAVNKLAEFQRQRVAEAREAAARSEAQGITLLAAGSLVGLLLSLACAWLLSRSILRPLAYASEVTDRIAEGDLTSAVPAPQAGSRDELRALLARLSGMQARLAELVVGMRQASTSVAGASSEIAAGNSDLSGVPSRRPPTLKRSLRAWRSSWPPCGTVLMRLYRPAPWPRMPAALPSAAVTLWTVWWAPWTALRCRRAALRTSPA